MTQQEEIFEKDRELQHTLDTISDTVNLLTEEVEILRDELEHIDDSSIQEDRPEILDSQQSDSRYSGISGAAPGASPSSELCLRRGSFLC